MPLRNSPCWLDKLYKIALNRFNLLEKKLNRDALVLFEIYEGLYSIRTYDSCQRSNLSQIASF